MTEVSRVNAIASKHPSLRLGELAWLSRPGAAIFPFNAPRRRYFTFARNALASALDSLRLDSEDEILVPAFHCVTVVEPVVRSGARCVFYAIDRRIRVDRASLRQAITRRTRAIVVIHFFGVPEPLDDICELCERRGIVLIEDCTHALYSSDAGRPAGTRGELAIFSLRKTLPVLGGALLVANTDTVALPPVARPPPWGYSLRAVRAAADMWKARPEPLEVPTTEAASVVNDATPETAWNANRHRETMDDWLYGYAFNPDLNDRRGSRICTWLAERIDPGVVQRRRRENHQHMLERLSNAATLGILLKELPNGVCPWAFSVDALGARGLDRRLRQYGVPAFTFGEVLHKALPAGAFPDAAYLSANLVQLPIHQGISVEQVERMADGVRKAIGTP